MALRMLAAVFSPKPGSSATEPLLQARSSLVIESIRSESQRTLIFCTQSLKIEQSEDIGWKFVTKVVVVGEASSGGEFGDFFSGGLANPIDGGETIFGDQGFERLG